ncbi:RdgB/HAM1 family non-canonical purine NTP pyrophosphatase [Fibrobacterota bacterium]
MGTPHKTWVLVTRNPGKAREFETLLEPRGISILTLNDIGFKDEIAETGETFEENARLKVKAVAGLTAYPVIADDSGLEVDYLQGRPGVRSARYAGEDAGDEENRVKLLKELNGVSERRARFVCLLAYTSGSGKHRLFRAVCEGCISLAQAGSNGFGYDPVFIPEGFDQTLGELDSSIKMSLSHRAKAVEKLLREMVIR